MPVATPKAIEVIKAVMERASEKDESEVVLTLSAEGRLPCEVRHVPVFSPTRPGKPAVRGVLLDQKPGVLIVSVLLEDLKAWFPSDLVDSDQGPEVA
jgi:hypothetical protein